MPNWKTQDMPDQTGRVAIVTGANSGLGFASTLALVKKGAQVVMASRDKTKSLQALTQIKTEFPQAKLDYIPLNLASLASVREFAAEFKQKYPRLDLLLNNAGVMAIPRSETADGFEMQLGTNHLGHFALTGLLLDVLTATPQSRVVSTSSIAHYVGKINFADLQSRQSYSRSGAYGQSKLANLLFALELQRRLQAGDFATISLAAHPGYSNTNLQHTSASLSAARLEMFFYQLSSPFVQNAAMGALPQLYAATAPGVVGGQYYGPRFLLGGYPRLDKAKAAAYNRETAQQLWQVSEELTGVHYDFTKKIGSGLVTPTSR